MTVQKVLFGNLYMAEYCSKNFSREVMKGMKATAHKAKHNVGIRLLGYDVAEDKTYIINEKDSIIIKKIFSMYSQGYVYVLNLVIILEKIAKKYNAERQGNRKYLRRINGS